MADFQPVPAWAQPFLSDDPEELQRLGLKFNPVWLQYFLELIQTLEAAGGTTLQHNMLGGLQGGTASEFYHLTSALAAATATAFANQSANRVFAGPATGAAVAPAFRALVAADLPLTLASGVYTPTLTNVLNITASTPSQLQYMRVGSVVTVGGVLTATPTAPGLAAVGISLPVASNFAAPTDAGGAAASTGVAFQSAGIVADLTNDRAQMTWVAVDTTSQPMWFTFVYQVI